MRWGPAFTCSFRSITGVQINGFATGCPLQALIFMACCQALTERDAGRSPGEDGIAHGAGEADEIPGPADLSMGLQPAVAPAGRGRRGGLQGLFQFVLNINRCPKSLPQVAATGVVFPPAPASLASRLPESRGGGRRQIELGEIGSKSRRKGRA